MCWTPAETRSASSFVAICFWEQGISTVDLDGNYVVGLCAAKIVWHFLSQMLSLCSCVTPSYLSSSLYSLILMLLEMGMRHSKGKLFNQGHTGTWWRICCNIALCSVLFSIFSKFYSNFCVIPCHWRWFFQPQIIWECKHWDKPSDVGTIVG